MRNVRLAPRAGWRNRFCFAIDGHLVVVGRIQQFPAATSVQSHVRQHQVVDDARAPLSNCVIRLDEVRSSERVGRIRHTAFMHNDLLRARQRRRESISQTQASSSELVSRVRFRPSPRTASAVRTTLFIGCCAVSGHSAVCVWNRSAHHGFLHTTAPSSFCARSAAPLNLASSKKSLCALKKTEFVGTNSSTFSNRAGRPTSASSNPVAQREAAVLELRHRRSWECDMPDRNEIS